MKADVFMLLVLLLLSGLAIWPFSSQSDVTITEASNIVELTAPIAAIPNEFGITVIDDTFNVLNATIRGVERQLQTEGFFNQIEHYASKVYEKVKDAINFALDAYDTISDAVSTVAFFVAVARLDLLMTLIT